MASLATGVAREMFDLPSPRPGDPSLSGSAQNAVEKEMIHAGFTDVRVEEMALTLEFPSTEGCTEYLMDVSPELVALIADKSSGQQAEFRQRLAEKLRQYVIVDGSVRVQNVTICAVGRR